MIAAALERVSRQVKTVWFWFTPFGGTVVQTRDAIAKCASGLDPRDPQTDRVTETVTSGRVFVTTWQSVAVSNAGSRKLRQDDDTEVSVDTLIAALRADGWLIGAVIDEAHHSFRGQNQAVRFYLEVLQPDVTIMATATPRDEDVKAFCQSVGVRPDQINKIGVARKDVVAARLNKVGVRAVSFRSVTRDARLIDTRETAVEAALAHHNRVKALLAERNIDLTPLLLIQVESGETSIAGMKRFLLDRGVPEDVIAQHSADQPDPYLHTIAYDEQKEILIFKMAVATGFDAPRAFTLASARSSRDRDFGMQLVGRIMRVHPKLRAYKTLPVELDYGFVFLAHPEAQAGLGTAAAELATLKTEISSVTDKVRTISIAVGKAAVTTPATGQSGEAYKILF
jgi:type III restriction enzyme